MGMKFALFCEIPVARPWDERSEYWAIHNTIEQAKLGDAVGFHSFWTVEHHFLEEFSHCSAPEVLYGAVASHTKNMRIGHGVRLLPKPYNHPIRTAEAAAMLDIISDGRLEFGTGRSSTRAELEGFRVDPRHTRAMCAEAIEMIVGAWTNDEFEFAGRYWSMPRRRVLPKPIQKPHPPLWGATSSAEGHELAGEQGLGLCSFAVGIPPEKLCERFALYRKGLARAKPVAKFVNSQVSTFTMVHCAETSERAYAVADHSFTWYAQTGARLIATVAEWMEGKDLGTYDYAADVLKIARQGRLDQLNFEYLRDSGSAVVGNPDDCIEAAKGYEAAGVDILFCLVNPLKIPHEEVMKSIELLGKYVLPEFR